VHASPVTEQVWPVFGQLALDVQDKPELLHVPASVGQFPGPVQAVVVDIEHVPGRIGHSAGSLPVTWHTAAGVRLQWPATPQLASIVQACPSISHVAPTTRHCGSDVQAVPLKLQCPLRMQAVSSKHGAKSRLHCPGWTGHRGSAPLVWQIALVNVQWPESGHSPGSEPLTLQVLPPTLQVPGIVGQASPRWQVDRGVAVQFPNDEQSPLAKQPGVPSREHVPGCCGHSAISGPEVWQAFPRMLHVPTLGQVDASAQSAPLLLHLPGGHVVTKVHIGHSSPMQGHTSGGLQVVVQSDGLGGTQTGAAMLQT
jgi:hypothetical protein